MGRPQLPQGVKLNFRIAGALSDEAGELLTDLSIINQRSIGFFLREGIDLLLEKHKAEIVAWRRVREHEAAE
jgi:hypothetical protein